MAFCFQVVSQTIPKIDWGFNISLTTLKGSDRDYYGTRLNFKSGGSISGYAQVLSNDRMTVTDFSPGIKIKLFRMRIGAHFENEKRVPDFGIIQKKA